MSDSEITLEVQVTSYSVKDDELVETTETREFSFHVIPGIGGSLSQPYFNCTTGPQGLPVARLPEAAMHGWCMQLGTPPVKVNGRWGGRNYQKLTVSPEQMARAYDEFVNSKFRR